MPSPLLTGSPPSLPPRVTPGEPAVYLPQGFVPTVAHTAGRWCSQTATVLGCVRAHCALGRGTRGQAGAGPGRSPSTQVPKSSLSAGPQAAAPRGAGHRGAAPGVLHPALPRCGSAEASAQAAVSPLHIFLPCTGLGAGQAAVWGGQGPSGSFDATVAPWGPEGEFRESLHPSSLRSYTSRVPHPIRVLTSIILMVAT